MRSNNKSASSGGLGFVSALQLVFIVLKLCKVITWPWLLVLTPLWIELLLIVLVVWFFTR